MVNRGWTEDSKRPTTNLTYGKEANPTCEMLKRNASSMKRVAGAIDVCVETELSCGTKCKLDRDTGSHICTKLLSPVYHLERYNEDETVQPKLCRKLNGLG